MNQIHPKSQTTQRLRQHPTAENTVVHSGWFGNLCALLVMGILVAFIIYIMLIAADKEALIKEQNQAQVRVLAMEALNE